MKYLFITPSHTLNWGKYNVKNNVEAKHVSLLKKYINI